MGRPAGSITQTARGASSRSTRFAISVAPTAPLSIKAVTNVRSDDAAMAVAKQAAGVIAAHAAQSDHAQLHRPSSYSGRRPADRILLDQRLRSASEQSVSIAGTELARRGRPGGDRAGQSLAFRRNLQSIFGVGPVNDRSTRPFGSSGRIDKAISCRHRRLGQRRRLDARGPHQMKDIPAGMQEIIGDDPSMTAPPNRLGTHDGAPSVQAHIPQP